MEVFMSKEAVDHPDHYGGKDNPYEAIKVIRAHRLNFALGSAVKYILRAGKKDPAKYAEDLRKAAWYLINEAEELEKQQPTFPTPGTFTTIGRVGVVPGDPIPAKDKDNG